MQRYFMVLCVIVMMASTSACGVETKPAEIWKGTKNLYNEYVNPPVTVNLTDVGPCTDYEMCLGGAISRVDQQLTFLQRVMESSDRSPDQAWVQGMVKRFPWLSGIALTDAGGAVVARYPEYSMKEFNASALFKEDPKQNVLALRAAVVDSPLGPEIYLGKPVYKEGALRGIIVVHFDIRALVGVSENPGSFIITTPGTLLWSGTFDAQTTPIPGVDWEKEVKSSNKGTISNANGTFYWTSTYFANLPIVYALPSKGNFPQHPEQLEILEQMEALTVPSFSKDMQPGKMKQRVDDADVAPLSESLDSATKGTDAKGDKMEQTAKTKQAKKTKSQLK